MSVVGTQPTARPTTGPAVVESVADTVQVSGSGVPAAQILARRVVGEVPDA